MFQFIYWLKAIAAVFITNSHYADIWPVSAMAAGGHLGNCLFFLVSGFCLCTIRDSFPRWYLKRIIRIYPALWVAIAMNLLLGFFSIHSFSGFVHCFFYPTWYHFVASIMILYALFYLVRKLQNRCKIDTHWVLLATLVLFAIVYIFFFDRSRYHIDNVEENWVRFQFWLSMMLGVTLREKYDTIEKTISPAEWAGTAILFVGYFAGKVLVSRYAALSNVQFLSPMLLIMLVWQISRIFIKLEKRGILESAGKWNWLVEFLASLTLEIYLVQNVIIHHLSTLPFPVDFIVVTGLILVAAWAVHQIASWLQKKCTILMKL